MKKTSKLVGIRHKGEAYIAKGHPTYGNVIETPGVIMQVDTIKEVREANGKCYWMKMIVEMSKKSMEIQVRIEECDQFVYVSKETE